MKKRYPKQYKYYVKKDCTLACEWCYDEMRREQAEYTGLEGLPDDGDLCSVCERLYDANLNIWMWGETQEELEHEKD